VLLFDIDGVLRDVAGSYRRAIRDTVCHFCGWTPDPADIDALKSEGRWNNDWEASRELIRRREAAAVPPFDELVAVFGDLYFGGDPDGDPALWRWWRALSSRAWRRPASPGASSAAPSPPPAATCWKRASAWWTRP
jgi:HAD superfamily hydrolase (TIGR01548 family)